MSRFEAMWNDLEERIQEARGAPIPRETEEALAWVQGQMSIVWNAHRAKKYVDEEET